MADCPCFGSDWIGKRISFFEKSNKLPSVWVLTEKLGDKSVQLTEDLYYSFEGAPSAAYGTFLCKNDVVPEEMAVMRVSLQIPYAGSELLPRPDVAKQACLDKFPSGVNKELTALCALTEQGCDSTPILLDSQLDIQGDNDILPGGFIVFLLTSQAPGIQLDPMPWSLDVGREEDLKTANFWQFTREERDNIREAVKIAWINCKNAGYIPREKRDHLFWDKETGKITIVGFRDCSQVKPGVTVTWNDIYWKLWNLAMPPPGYRSKKGSQLDFDSWTL